MSLRIRDVLRLYEKLDGNAGFRVELREGRDTLVKIFCLIYYIRNQFKLNESDFRDIIRCTLSTAVYKEILKDKGFL